MSDRTDELLGLAAFGELSDDEQRELDAIAASDAEVRSELDDLLAGATSLRRLTAERPPDALRKSVLDAIAATPQAPASSPDVSEEIGDGVDADDRSATVTDLGSRRLRRFAPVLGAAAALTLIVGLGVVFVSNGSDPVDQVAAVVTAEDASMRQLEGTLSGDLSVTYSPGEQAIVIDGDGLPVLGADRAFVLWLVSEEAAVPVETFRPDDSGRVLVRVDDVDPTDFVLGITEESAAGAETPTLPILASA